MKEHHSLTLGRVALVLLIGGAFVAGSIGHAAWATPVQDAQRQTVPTRTPSQTPASSSTPVTGTPGTPAPSQTQVATTLRTPTLSPTPAATTAGTPTLSPTPEPQRRTESPPASTPTMLPSPSTHVPSVPPSPLAASATRRASQVTNTPPPSTSALIPSVPIAASPRATDELARAPAQRAVPTSSPTSDRPTPTASFDSPGQRRPCIPWPTTLVLLAAIMPRILSVPLRRVEQSRE